MRINSLMTVAKAAGFAMAPSEEIFRDDPAPMLRGSPTSAIALAGPVHRSPAQAARVFLIRSRARLGWARNAQISQSIAGLLPYRAHA
jgi:hypothetical protein